MDEIGEMVFVIVTFALGFLVGYVWGAVGRKWQNRKEKNGKKMDEE